MVDIVKIAKALSDPIRYKIMQMLVESGEKPASLCGDGCYPGLCNCEIMAELGLIQSRVSYHMKELVDAGLVIEEQRGKWKYYLINTPTLKEYIKSLEQSLIKS